MRVLITDHSVYIGSVMVPVLDAGGHEVGLDNFLFEDCSLGEGGDRAPALRKDIRGVRARTGPVL